MTLPALKEKPWWSYLEETHKDLLSQSLTLAERESELKSTFHDYSFIVFSAAKAYEGFLKKAFFDLGFISKKDYLGDRFRIGRALNPALEKKYAKREGVYTKLADYCGSSDLPEFLWNTWKFSRNRIFHWFPQELRFLSLEEAEERLLMIVEAIDRTFEECRLSKVV